MINKWSASQTCLSNVFATSRLSPVRNLSGGFRWCGNATNATNRANYATHFSCLYFLCTDLYRTSRLPLSVGVRILTVVRNAFYGSQIYSLKVVYALVIYVLFSLNRFRFSTPCTLVTEAKAAQAACASLSASNSTEFHAVEILFAAH